MSFQRWRSTSFIWPDLPRSRPRGTITLSRSHSHLLLLICTKQRMKTVTLTLERQSRLSMIVWIRVHFTKRMSTSILPSNSNQLMMGSKDQNVQLTPLESCNTQRQPFFEVTQGGDKVVLCLHQSLNMISTT